MGLTISKKNSVIVVVIIVGLIGYLLYGEYAESKSVVVCGRFVGVTSMNGASYIKFEFVYNGVRQKGAIYRPYLKRV